MVSCLPPLEVVSHPQPQTPVHIDNTTAVGIVNSTIKRQRSRAMEMRYFWLLDQYVQKRFSFSHHPGAENLGDYPSKAHTGRIHRHVRPYFQHEDNSPRDIPRAAMPSTRRGCAEILGDLYIKGYPLPRIQDRAQGTARTSVGQLHRFPRAACAIASSHAGTNGWHLRSRHDLARTAVSQLTNYLVPLG